MIQCLGYQISESCDYLLHLDEGEDTSQAPRDVGVKMNTV